MKIPKLHQFFLSVVDVCKFIYQLKLTNETKIPSFTRNTVTNTTTFTEIIFRLYVARRYVLFAPNEAVSG